MYSTMNTHLAATRLEDTLRDAGAARAVRRPRRGRPHVWFAMAGQRKPSTSHA
jgi:hypothetical protein